MPDETGFLTSADRTFLRGENGPKTKQGRYQRRKSIRERTRGAYLDFTLLLEHLDHDQRRQIFEPVADGVYHPHVVREEGPEPPEEYKEARALRDGLFSTLAFMYLGLWGTATRFTELVEAAIFQSERDDLDRMVDVELTINQKDPFRAIESAIDKLEQEAVSDLTHTEQRLLMEFLMNPTSFGPGTAREEAIDRLNEVGAFSLSESTEE